MADLPAAVRNKTQGNNFDFIRFLAAMLVWYSHSRYFCGISNFFPYLGVHAVFTFMIVSGYLVTASYERLGSVRIFLINRALRILPGLSVVILLSVFVIGPVATSLTLKQYFAQPETWNYLRGLLVLPKFHLPGVFSNHLNNAVNGSIWTLPYEVLCYGFVALLGMCSLLRGSTAMTVFVALWCFRIYERLSNLDMVPATFLTHVSPLWVTAVDLGSFFAAGSFMYLSRAKVPLRFELFAVAVALSLLSCVLWSDPRPPHMWGDSMLFDAAFAYIVIYLSLTKLPGLEHFGKYGDFSYGIYIYAWPVQQLMVSAYPHPNFYVFLIVNFLAVFSCAYISWHLIERPALSLKPRSLHAV